VPGSRGGRGTERPPEIVCPCRLEFPAMAAYSVADCIIRDGNRYCLRAMSSYRGGGRPHQRFAAGKECLPAAIVCARDAIRRLMSAGSKLMDAASAESCQGIVLKLAAKSCQRDVRRVGVSVGGRREHESQASRGRAGFVRVVANRPHAGTLGTLARDETVTRF